MSSFVEPAKRPNWTLFAASILSLFLELMLIRWISTEVRLFAYLQNTILVVCFLGLGMGYFTCREPFRLRDVLQPLVILVLILVPCSYFSLGSRVSMMLNSFGDVLIFTDITATYFQKVLYLVVGLAFAFMLLVLVWDTFLPLGRLLGHLFQDSSQPITAYSVDVAGSILGVWLFVLLSALQTPPVVWAVVFVLLALVLAWLRGPIQLADWGWLGALVVLAALAGWEMNAVDVRWSPYQKLALKPREESANIPGKPEYILSVNNAGGFQAMLELSNPKRHRALTAYDLPSLVHPNPKKLLILGAGSGNGTSAAVRHGVPDITSVEIDPVIIALGRRYHPAQPYSSPQVHVVNDDARAFFANCTEKYDVISFEFLDSHTMTSMTNVRLDHYVYTRESFARARELLAENGILVLTFGYERVYIADRMNSALREVFGQEPYFFHMPSEPGVLVVGDIDTAKRQIQKTPGLPELITQAEKEDGTLTFTGATRLATDDWPYIYLEGTTIPPLYFCLAAMLGLLFYRGLRRIPANARIRFGGRSDWHFAFLGAAFLLLEVQNVSKASLALGTTWWVNAVIITAVLVLVLVSNLTVSLWPQIPLLPVYVLLCATCLGLYFVDLSRFNFLSFTPRAAMVGLLTSLPMLFSGIVFIRSFAEVKLRNHAMGANLFGALVGGLLQSLTFLTGIQALLLIVAALYAAAWLSRPMALEVPALKEVEASGVA